VTPPWVAVAPTRLAPGRVAGWTDSAEGVPTEYLAGLRRAGAVPVVVGDPGGVAADVLLAPWSGLLLCGGADVDPHTYGQVPDPTVYGVDRQRDDFELALARAAWDTGLPVLAVCRGIQVLNVALGGTLVQHLPARGGPLAHGVPVGDGEPAVHPVDVAAGSRLAAAVGATRIERCISIHHQAVDVVADGLVVTARSADGVVEAVEPGPEGGWCVAVQWHPERSAAVDPAQQAVFDGFVAACRERTVVPAR
jgi:putative glutamine amidotransferase